MSKFKEGEIVRSVLKGDREFPFFKVYKTPDIEQNRRAFGMKINEYYLVRLDNNPHGLPYACITPESSLRHTEYDQAGDE